MRVNRVGRTESDYIQKGMDIPEIVESPVGHLGLTKALLKHHKGTRAHANSFLPAVAAGMMPTKIKLYEELLLHNAIGSCK